MHDSERLAMTEVIFAWVFTSERKVLVSGHPPFPLQTVMQLAPEPPRFQPEEDPATRRCTSNMYATVRWQIVLCNGKPWRLIGNKSACIHTLPA